MLQLDIKEKRPTTIQKTPYGALSGEAVVFCPRCKVMETVWISNNMLVPTRKFIQAGTRIYHDCGSSQPCRLYQSW